MKRDSLFAVATGVVSLTAGMALLGLPGCAPNPPGPQQTQQEVKITGSGSTYPAMKALADAYEAKEDTIEIEFLPPSQSENGISGAREGLVDLGSLSRTLKPEEDDGTLVYREVARDALTVATHADVGGVTDLKTEDLKAIYSGETTNWQQLGGPDAKIVVLDRPEDESGKRLLRDHYLGQDLKNAPDAVVLRHESDLIEAVTGTPYSIGAFSLAYAISNQLTVNRLSLDDVAPSPETVQAGQYPMVRTLGIVSRQSPSEATQSFIDFIFSDAGSQALLKAGFVPSAQPQE